MIALVVAALAGGVSVFAFAPFGAFPIALASLAVLVWLVARSPGGPRRGFALGFSWGIGAFLAGVSWLYVALNRYGGVPMPISAALIVLFCAYLALFPAAATALFVRLRQGGPFPQAALFAGAWVLAEWLRGWLFTGFPWLAVGYSQTPPSPLAGFLPVIGVFGVGGLVAFAAALVALTPWRVRAPALVGTAALMVVLGIGAGLGRIAWTSPEGEPLRVALVQTNIEQGLKWEPGRLAEWLEVNARLAREHAAELVVLPETTLPLVREQLPRGYLDEIADESALAGRDVVLGVFARDGAGHIYNAAISLGESAPQYYAKQHLVPFGEYSPPFFGWFYRLADIPMSDQTRGPRSQPPMALRGQRIAVNICYEDLFGRELIRSLPEATLMLNLSNLAWYGRSLAQPQHLQIARVRAIETGRPMLRSTNTGMTAVIEPDGRVAGVLPQFERGALELDVRGYQGLTPYARWGDLVAWALAVLALVTGTLPPRLRGRNTPGTERAAAQAPGRP